MRRFLLATALFTATAGLAHAGSGSLDGQHRFDYNGLTHTLMCNSHVDPTDGQAKVETFSCEYLNRTSSVGPNQSLFIGKLRIQQRGSIFHMTQLGDDSGYVAELIGQRGRSGEIEGIALDLEGRQMKFVIYP